MPLLVVASSSLSLPFSPSGYTSALVAPARTRSRSGLPATPYRPPAVEPEAGRKWHTECVRWAEQGWSPPAFVVKFVWKASALESFSLGLPFWPLLSFGNEIQYVYHGLVSILVWPALPRTPINKGSKSVHLWLDKSLLPQSSLKVLTSISCSDSSSSSWT